MTKSIQNKLLQQQLQDRRVAIVRRMQHVSAGNGYY
jgi:hypothetical protein